MMYQSDRSWGKISDYKRDSAIAGAEAGLISGLVMMLALMVYTAALGEGFFFPLQQVAATFLGVEALIGGVGTILLGAAIHFAVAAAWGIGFGLMVPPVTSSSSAAGWGAIYAVGVWLVMTFVALPVFDPVMSDRVALYSGWWFASHLLYGAVLGLTPELTQQMLVRETHTETYRRAA